MIDNILSGGSASSVLAAVTHGGPLAGLLGTLRNGLGRSQQQRHHKDLSISDQHFVVYTTSCN
ncbi:hypothetical protein K8T06_15990 [bacterium]|nr:hypothetical protein [bacterium]